MWTTATSKFDDMEDTCAIDVAQRGRQTQKDDRSPRGHQPRPGARTEQEMRRQLVRKVRKHVPVEESEWGPSDADGGQTCIPCRAEGEVNDVECANCDGDGYRWSA